MPHYLFQLQSQHSPLRTLLTQRYCLDLLISVASYIVVCFNKRHFNFFPIMCHVIFFSSGSVGECVAMWSCLTFRAVGWGLCLTGIMLNTTMLLSSHRWFFLSCLGSCACHVYIAYLACFVNLLIVFKPNLILCMLYHHHISMRLGIPNRLVQLQISLCREAFNVKSCGHCVKCSVWL